MTHKAETMCPSTESLLILVLCHQTSLKVVLDGKKITNECADTEFFFLVTVWSMWDLNSPTRDQTHSLGSESEES